MNAFACYFCQWKVNIIIWSDNKSLKKVVILFLTTNKIYTLGVFILSPKEGLFVISINLLVVYRESVNLIGYITRRLSADSHQLWIANENRSSIYFDQSRSFKFWIVYHEF